MEPGARRAQLDATLSAAYAEGLLSDDTFAARLAQLRSGPIEPQRLIGDVTLRGPGSGPLGTSPGARARRAGVAARARASEWRQRLSEAALSSRRAVPLLALDWSGETGTLLIGRDEECDIRLSDPAVSRHHARLRFWDGGWVLRDLGSLNGTTLNGHTVVRSRLRAGDLVAFAGRRFRVD